MSRAMTGSTPEDIQRVIWVSQAYSYWTALLAETEALTGWH